MDNVSIRMLGKYSTATSVGTILGRVIKGVEPILFLSAKQKVHEQFRDWSNETGMDHCTA